MDVMKQDMQRVIVVVAGDRVRWREMIHCSDTRKKQLKEVFQI